MADPSPVPVLAAAGELRGKQVKVTLGPNLTITGKLLDFTRDGGVKLDSGWAWPMLAVEEVPGA